MPHELPALTYALDALQPHMSRETLEFHHGKHHRTYVDNLNQLVRGTEFEREPLEAIVQRSNGALFNNAAQAWNHAFFWQCLAPAAGTQPGGEFAQALRSAFGSLDNFRNKFSECAEGRFGSGWAWLSIDPGGQLHVSSTANAGTPLATGHMPLLACDVWEHAYYIDYRNSRKDFIAAFWNLVNWEFVQSGWMKSRAAVHA